MAPQVWLITGASSGLGLRLVSAVLARGDYVIATYRSSDKTGGLVYSPNVSSLHLLQLDVTESSEDISAKIAAARAHWGRIDVLVNNAGFFLPTLLEEAGIEGAMSQFNANYFGVVKVTNAVLPEMRARRSGTIVIIGSRSGWKADIPGTGHYAASKAAVHAYGECLSVEVAPFSIRVLLVQPGLFRTEGIHAVPLFAPRPLGAYDALRGAVAARVAALGRRRTDIGDPAKAAGAVVDVVRGEGRAEGRPFPLLLVLGEDAEVDVRKICNRGLDTLEEWKDVTRDTKLE